MNDSALFNNIKSYRDKIRTQIKLNLKLNKKIPIISNNQLSNENTPDIKVRRDFHSKYLLHEKIGEGAHAIVKKATLIKDPLKVFAVKIFRTGEPEIITQIRKTYYNAKLLE